jgi:hypothetical protein
MVDRKLALAIKRLTPGGPRKGRVRRWKSRRAKREAWINKQHTGLAIAMMLRDKVNRSEP